MAYPISFDKATSERFLAALQSGQPIEPPEGRWTIHNMLAAAGACYFAAMSHGPLSFKEMPGAWEKLPAEHREAREQTLSDDLSDAIAFYGHLTMLVKDGEFDEHFEPQVKALVFRGENGKSSLLPYEGFREK